MDISSTFLSSMKNPADLRTLGICSAKWLITLLVWHAHPSPGCRIYVFDETHTGRW